MPPETAPGTLPPQSRHGETPEADLPRVLLGAECVRRLTTMMRTVRTHGTANAAFRRQVPEFLGALNRLLESSPDVSVTLLEDYLYVDGIRLTARVLPPGVAQLLAVELERVRAGGIGFVPGVTGEELGRFLALLVASPAGVEAPELEGRLREAGVETITLLPSSAPAGLDGPGGRADSDGGLRDPARRARRTYDLAVSGTRRLFRKAAKTGVPNLLVARRVMQPLVDSILRNEYAIIGLTALKSHDGYTYRHCLNVGLLALAMGRVLGLNRRQLAELGVTGLLHDVGKIAVAPEVLRKPGKLTDAEWRILQRHPLAGARLIARMPGLSRLMCDAMRVSLEHHMQPDGGGYPGQEARLGPAAGSRIVAVADCYDALTAHRAYRARPFSPYEALQHVQDQSGSRFDPGAVWTLGRVLGRYPPGTFVVTRTGVVALATSPNPLDPERPYCRVVALPDGTAVPEEAPVRWDPMPAGESVARVLPPGESPYDAQRLLAA